MRNLCILMIITLANGRSITRTISLHPPHLIRVQALRFPLNIAQLLQDLLKKEILLKLAELAQEYQIGIKVVTLEEILHRALHKTLLVLNEVRFFCITPFFIDVL
jgi:hypothetical protein